MCIYINTNMSAYVLIHTCMPAYHVSIYLHVYLYIYIYKNVYVNISISYIYIYIYRVQLGAGKTDADAHNGRQGGAPPIDLHVYRYISI